MNNYATRKYDRITDIHDSEKISLLLKTIPYDVNTIIDIGCGNGLITNELSRDYQVLGVDINASKLAFVKASKLQASCDQVPVDDRSFDLVFSSEMIEHLDNELMKRTFREFDRISRKYILITVPNEEPLHKLLVKCESCGQLYHKNGHLRSFRLSTFPDYFPNYEVLTALTFGGQVRDYLKLLADVKHRYAPADSWLPAHWVRAQGVPFHFCTHCGHKNFSKSTFHPVSMVADSLNTLISPKMPGHMMVLLKRREP